MHFTCCCHEDIQDTGTGGEHRYGSGIDGHTPSLTGCAVTGYASGMKIRTFILYLYTGIRIGFVMTYVVVGSMRLETNELY